MELLVILFMYELYTHINIFKLRNVFVFPDPETPAINILYEWSVISGQFGLCSFISSFVI